VNAKPRQAHQDGIRAASLTPNPARRRQQLSRSTWRRRRPSRRTDYKYVATLGYFTPRQLPGRTIVTAEQVATPEEGATLYDTRSAEEYAARHIQGAKLLPYGEKSRKEVGSTRRPTSSTSRSSAPTRNAPLIFACNGAECWKSYKPASRPPKAGYKQVYWFRGGFPEWNMAGCRRHPWEPPVAQKK